MSSHSYLYTTLPFAALHPSVAIAVIDQTEHTGAAMLFFHGGYNG
jgi:hypothetical protein